MARPTATSRTWSDRTRLQPRGGHLVGKTAEPQSDSKYPSLPAHDATNSGVPLLPAEIASAGAQRLAQGDRGDTLLAPSLSAGQRERTVLAMQRLHGNGFVQRL